MFIFNYLDRQPKFVVVIISLLMLGIIGFLDWQIPDEIVLSIYYLLPVALATWFLGRSTGFLFSIFSAIIIFFANRNESCNPSNFAFVRQWNAAVALLVFLIVSATLSELHSVLIRENKLSRTDGLTGISNRRDFLETVNRVIAEATRYRYPLTLAYIDVDFFKEVNDTLGHHVGDRVLQIIAKELKICLRVTDGVGRLGGDEFAILLPQIAYEPAIGVITRVQQALLSSMAKQGLFVTFSIGVVTFISPPISVDVLIEKADSLMYKVKKSGRNRVEHIIVE